jgi:hypothetical protein
LVVNVSEHQLETISIGGTAAASAVVIGSAPKLLTDAIDAYLAAAQARGEEHQIVAFDAPKQSVDRSNRRKLLKLDFRSCQPRRE